MSQRFTVRSKCSKWLMWPGLVSGLAAVSLGWWYRDHLLGSSQVSASTIPAPAAVAPAAEPEFGVRQQLTYADWVRVLEQEAAAIARKHPAELNVLAGDSLSLWFPPGLLPERATWLNQGISGETSYGLLKRLRGFEQTQPQIIFVMIGINDLIQGVGDETLLANQREILTALKTAHPQARIVLQSILPHGGDRARQRYLASVAGSPILPVQPKWVDRLPKISHQHLQRLNAQLAAIAQQEQVEFLNLYDLFLDENNLIRAELTTDGLHLSAEGYAVWRSQLEQVMATSPPPPIPTEEGYHISP